MRTTVNSRNLELTEALRAQIDRKLHRLERITHPDADATVELIVHASRAAETSHVAEVSLMNNGTVIRSVGTGPSMTAALDNLVDRLERQVVRSRERPRSVRDRAEEGLQDQRSTPPNTADGEAEGEASGAPQVVEIKRYDMTPMFEEDAILRMDELGHAFFVFLNAETDRIGVVYRRGDGSYGMIDPVVGRSGRAS
ncbi:MAG: ribosome-associated translation inhibitor RaiA [Chloroflexi bacterium]|nr:ribosome-associated translation inhibitor RaiA [Chloroflexota bacterium]